MKKNNVDWLSENIDFEPKVGEKCFYFSYYKNQFKAFKTKILSEGKDKDYFDIRAAMPNNDYSGLYPIMLNVHKSNLCDLETLTFKIKDWGINDSLPS